MKRTIALLALLICCSPVLAQTATELYRKGDASLNDKDYLNAAQLYAAGIRAEGTAANIMRYRTAAASWAQAGMADSAFHFLEMAAASSLVNRTLARNVEFGPEFTSLHTDKRWKTTLASIQSKAETNGYVQEEFIYGRKDGVALTLIQIKPKQKPNGKGIIFVVSGNWVSAYNGIEFPTLTVEAFLKKGYTVFAVVHGSNPRYAIPDAVADLKRSVRYLRYNAQKFGIDPDNIGITGISAGGHLSLMVATSDEQVNALSMDPVERVSARVQAVAVLHPPTDLLNWGAPGMNLVNAKELVKARGVYGAIDFRVWNDRYRIYEEVSDSSARTKIGREISPINHVSADDPPVFIIHGDADATVPLQQSQILIAKLNEAGVKNKLIVKKGGRHIFQDMLPEQNQFADWFDEHLK
jgi:acetyl esterase/lipase